MTQDDVRGELDRQFPTGGRFPRPTELGGEDSLCFQLDPDDGRYNAELVVGKMAGGKVAPKEYLPD